MANVAEVVLLIVNEIHVDGNPRAVRERIYNAALGYDLAVVAQSMDILKAKIKEYASTSGIEDNYTIVNMLKGARVAAETRAAQLPVDEIDSLDRYYRRKILETSGQVPF